MKNIKKKIHKIKIDLWHFFNRKRVERYSKKYFLMCYGKRKIDEGGDEE